MDNNSDLRINLPNDAAKVEHLYNNNGKRAQVIIGERAGYIRNVRRLCTEIEFELLNDTPDNMRIISLATEMETMVSSIRSISYREIGDA